MVSHFIFFVLGCIVGFYLCFRAQLVTDYDKKVFQDDMKKIDEEKNNDETD